MKLYSSTRSPFVRKVLICAHEAGLLARIDLVPTLVSFLRADEDVGRHNPLGQIPTLVLDNGEALYDSGVICAYFDGLVPDARLLPHAPGPARHCALRQVQADGLMATFMRWYGERRRAADPLSRDYVAISRGKLHRVLDRWERDAADWAALPFDVGFAAIACALAYADFRFAGETWRDGRPALSGWYAGIEGRPSIAATAFRDG